MELFPKQIRALAQRNGTLSTTAPRAHVAKMSNEVDVRAALRAIPNREKFVLLLALLATATNKSPPLADDLAAYGNQSTFSKTTPSSKQIDFLAKLADFHGHSASFTVAAIHAAYRSAYFDRSLFDASRTEDPEFWELLTNHGRPKMPRSVFGPYTLFAAERKLGEPIRDLTKIGNLLAPPAEPV